MPVRLARVKSEVRTLLISQFFLRVSVLKRKSTYANYLVRLNRKYGSPRKAFVMHWAAVIDFTIRKKKNNKIKLKLFHLDSTGFLNVNFKTPAIEKKRLLCS